MLLDHLDIFHSALWVVIMTKMYSDPHLCFFTALFTIIVAPNNIQRDKKAAVIINFLLKFL